MGTFGFGRRESTGGAGVFRANGHCANGHCANGNCANGHCASGIAQMSLCEMGITRPNACRSNAEMELSAISVNSKSKSTVPGTVPSIEARISPETLYLITGPAALGHHSERQLQPAELEVLHTAEIRS